MAENYKIGRESNYQLRRENFALRSLYLGTGFYQYAELHDTPDDAEDEDNSRTMDRATYIQYQAKCTNSTNYFYLKIIIIWEKTLTQKASSLYLSSFYACIQKDK